jgi:hypothetical protein
MNVFIGTDPNGKDLSIDTSKHLNVEGMSGMAESPWMREVHIERWSFGGRLMYHSAAKLTLITSCDLSETPLAGEPVCRILKIAVQNHNLCGINAEIASCDLCGRAFVIEGQFADSLVAYLRSTRRHRVSSAVADVQIAARLLRPCSAPSFCQFFQARIRVRFD